MTFNILNNVDEYDLDQGNPDLFSDDDLDEYIQSTGPTVEERLAAVEKELAESKKREAEKDAKIVELSSGLEELWKVVLEGKYSNTTVSSQEASTEDPIPSDDEEEEEDAVFIPYWRCETYNNSYNMLYQMFASNPDERFKKNELKDEWLSTNPKNKTQIETSLNRLIEVGFVEEEGKRGSKTYKLSHNETRNADELFKAIGRNANTARTALIR